MRSIQSLKEISEKYTVFILDMWGVLYDGEQLFPPVLECLKNLAEADKNVYLLTNNSQANEDNISKLEKIGLTTDYYKSLLSAGQKSLDMFRDRSLFPHSSRPLKAYILEEGVVCKWASHAELEKVNRLEEADFILGFHIDPHHHDMSIYQSLLKEALIYKLPFVCTNPDLYVTREREKFVRVGRVANVYEELGGEVYYIGKPYLDIYQEILNQYSLEQILIVGDSLTTDIKGANEIGVDSLLIASGNHCQDISGLSLSDLGVYFQEYEATPSYICPYFRW